MVDSHADCDKYVCKGRSRKNYPTERSRSSSLKYPRRSLVGDMDWLALGGLFSPAILTGESERVGGLFSPNFLTGGGERVGALGSLDSHNFLAGAGERVGTLGGLL